MNIKTSSLDFLVLYHEIFCSKKAGKITLDFMINGHWFSFELVISYKKIPTQGGDWDSF
jgi:hypothetical protein